MSPEPCTSTEHEHDISDPVFALDAVMAAQWEAARSTRPDVLIELKQDYGNVRLLRHGTMVRAGDTAYDIDTNLMRCTYTQAFASCVHVDPLVTSVYTKPQSIALMMSKALMGGVPTFSMNLPNFSEDQRAVMTAWLKLYNDHRELFKTRRQPMGDHMEVWQGGGPEHWWLGACGRASELSLPRGKSVLLLNGTGRDAFHLLDALPQPVRVRTLDYRHQLVAESTLAAGQKTLKVAPAGLSVLTWL